MAARLAPDDIDILRKSAEMNAEDPTRWREMARAIAAEWQLHPEDGVREAAGGVVPAAGKKDAAEIAAAAMVLRGLGDDEIAKLASQSRPTALRRISIKLPANWPGRIGYSPEFADVESLIALLVDSGVLPPVTTAEVGLDGETPIPPNQQPALFRPMLR